MREGLYPANVWEYDASTGRIVCTVPQLFGLNHVTIDPYLSNGTDLAKLEAPVNGDLVLVYFQGGNDSIPRWLPRFATTSHPGSLNIAGGLTVGGTSAFNGPVVVDNSTSLTNLPLQFEGDPNTGMRRSGTDAVDIVTGGTARMSLSNTGVYVPALQADSFAINDTNDSHPLIVAVGSDLSAQRTLTLTPGDADRTLTLTGNATLNQDVSTTGTPTFSRVQTPTVRSDSAVEAQKNDGTVVAPLYAYRRFTATLGSNQEYTYQAAQGDEVTMLTVSFSTIRPNALVRAVGNTESNISVAGAGVCVVACEFDDVQTGDNINFPNTAVNPRVSISRTWFGTFASAGAHTVKLSIRKNTSTLGTINATATNTNLLVEVFE